jgi:uncharacterized protein YjbJ (UPF0337 family)
VSKLTDEDLQSIAGRRIPLSGKIQERYGVGRKKAEKQMVAWEQTMNDTVLGKRSG